MLVLLLGACDTGRPDEDHPSRGLDVPAPRVLAVEATTGYDTHGQPVRSPLAEGGVTPGVSRSASIRFTFDRFLLPVSVIRQAICLRPAVDEVVDLNACREPFQVFTEPAYDPYERTVTFRLPAGTRLVPQTRYRLTVFQADEDMGSGFQSFDRVPLDRPYVFELETQAEGGDERDEVLPSPAAYCASIACFEGCGGDPVCEEGCHPTCVEPTCFNQGRLYAPPQAGPSATFSGCAGATCHGPVTTADASNLAMGMDLFTLGGLDATVFDVVAHQTQQGEGATIGDVNPQRFGRAMPRIDPSNPGNSYVLYKLIANPLNHPRPGGTLDPGLAAELERLRASVVTGLPMPAKGDGVARGFTGLEDDADGSDAAARMRRLSTWIAAGAVVECP